MQDLIINQSKTAPAVHFRPNGQLNIDGRSILEDPAKYYQELINWLIEYFKAPADITQLIVKMEYLNSGSSKYMTSVMRILEEQQQKGRKINVEWHYEDDDESVLELGQHFADNLKLNLKLIPHAEDE